jgi:hypothetical protein
MLAPPDAMTTNRAKLDPRLVTFVEDAQLSIDLHELAARTAGNPLDRMRPAFRAARESLVAGIDVPPPPPGAKAAAIVPLAHVFIQIGPGRSDFSDCVDAGANPYVTVRRTMGDVVTAIVPLDRIDDLSGMPGVELIELSRPVKLRGVFLSGAGEVGASGGSIKATQDPIDGAGVVIGVVDSGIDFRHPAFVTAQGQSRIEMIWDQNLVPQAGEHSASVGGYGVEYTHDDVQKDLEGSNLVRHVDDDGHGTAMASLACGNGRGSEDGNGDIQYPGVAPKAALVVVAIAGTAGENGVGGMSEVADAMAYVFDKAGARPCVVNLSLGDGLGPHDGSTLVERAIDNSLANADRVVVVAAGNANGFMKHTRGTVGANATRHVGFKVGNDKAPPGASVVPAGELEIWYAGAKGLHVKLVGPNGEVAILAAPAKGYSVEKWVFGTTTLVITSGVGYRNEPKNVIRIALSSSTTSLDLGTWDVRLESTSTSEVRYDGWTQDDDADPCGDFGLTFVDAAEGDCTVTTPGTSARAITVGSYGVDHAQNPCSPFSGRGPTRGDAHKPDFVAPGTGSGAGDIACANSEGDGSVANPYYVNGKGTSVATALVSGCAALVLQHEGTGTSVGKVIEVLSNLASKGKAESKDDVGNGRVSVLDL